MNNAILNNMTFVPDARCEYKRDYIEEIRCIDKLDSTKAIERIRELILDDLFFIVFFVLRIPNANAPFVVDACREMETGPRTRTLDIWARFHFKSTIITIAETIQYHLKNPDHCTCIFSYKKAAAEKFLSAIRQAYESDFLKFIFPDILFSNPFRDSPSWSLQNGITLNRKNNSRPQRTVQASGLVEGMLQGDHFERRIYDDIETDDMKYSQEQLDKCFDKYNMSVNLGTGRDSDIERIIGTYYSHMGPLVRIRDMTDIHGRHIYTTRIKPATIDGDINGEPVLISQQKLDELKKLSTFYSQQMCDPTPKFDVALAPDLLKEVSVDDLPINIYKFMLIDPAGSHVATSSRERNDNWAIHIIGVDPAMDNIGASNIYILDSFIDKINESEVVFLLSNMYWRNGLIEQVAYERFGGVTPGWLVHFLNSLHSRGIIVSEETKNLVVLNPKSQEKKSRITSALRLPLLNGKIHYLNTVPEMYIEQLKKEMQLHPVWHDDGIDALAYIYQILDAYGFKWRFQKGNKQNHATYSHGSAQNIDGWLGV